MASRLLQLDDVRQIETPEKIAFLFKKLGYNASAQQLAVDDLELPSRSAEAIWNAHLIADQGKGALQVLLFQLQAEEFSSPAIASSRMRSIAQSLCKRPSDFLLLGTKDYNQLMLVNPRKRFDAQMNLKVSIRKLLIDRTNPTNYDRDRLEAIAARNFNPQELYKAQCEAFDVEKLTKEFYRGYREIFEYVQQVIKDNNPHSYFDDKSRLHQFSQRLLGRIMFLYFLQKKGFLAGERNFLKNQYPRQSEPEDTDFYTGVLEPLFFDTLNQQRLNHDSPWGKIPYLNGGLFEKDYGDGLIDSTGVETAPQIQLPNSLFDPSGEKGILKFFNGYNFTIDENIQGDEEVAVDPEMLGKVFENLLAAEERGQSGTFYTPRPIVHFMCVESLSRYLADSSGMTPDAIKQLIELDPDITNADLGQLLTKEQARKLKQALEEVKCLDPAVGSAAFPLGMMQVILAVKQAIAHREDGRPVERGSLTISRWKRDIIENNLYGVDIKPEAIEIAKLRMWLSLVVDIPTVDDVDPLPNLDYKLMCGDSLISTINGEQLIPDPTKDIQQLELNVTPVQTAIQPLLRLQHQYYSAHSEERKALRKQIVEAEKNVFRVATADRRQFWETKQRKLEQDIQRMGRASRTQIKEQQVIAEKLAELDKFAAEVESGKRSLSFFQYHLHFNGVFQQKGGFDIVIGNPPYVRQERLSEQYKVSLKVEFSELYKGTADIYTYFYGKGVNLLRDGGYLSFISSNKFMKAGYGDKLRRLLSSQITLHQLIDFGDAPVFDANAYPSIILISKKKPENHQTCVLNWDAKKLIDDFASVFKNYSFHISQAKLSFNGWQLESSEELQLLDKIRSNRVTLGKIVEGKLYRGIVTGLNEAFVIDSTKRSELIKADPRSNELIKPFLRGRDVRRWKIVHPDLFLIFTRKGTNIDSFPAIKKHLEQFRSDLEKRLNVIRDGDEWFQIPYAISYYKEFEKPKIIYQEIATYQSFTLDASSSYLNNKVFLIADADLYLLSLLNSKVVWFFLSHTTSKLQGGAYAMQMPYVSQIPIPNASAADREAISTLAQKCLDTEGQGVTEWEAEIDERVGHLYGLTAQEMKIIKAE